jgi:hypothetical protein
VGAEAESSGRSAIQSERCDAAGARGTRARVSRGRRRGRRREREEENEPLGGGGRLGWERCLFFGGYLFFLLVSMGWHLALAGAVRFESSDSVAREA